MNNQYGALTIFLKNIGNRAELGSVQAIMSEESKRNRRLLRFHSRSNHEKLKYLLLY